MIRARLLAEALDRTAGMNRLRRVHADQPHAADALDDDRVAVDDPFDDLGGGGSRLRETQPLSASRRMIPAAALRSGQGAPSGSLTPPLQKSPPGAACRWWQLLRTRRWSLCGNRSGRGGVEAGVTRVRPARKRELLRTAASMLSSGQPGARSSAPRDSCRLIAVAVRPGAGCCGWYGHGPARPTAVTQSMQEEIARRAQLFGVSCV